MSFITVMKDISLQGSRSNVFHNRDEGHNVVGEPIICPS